MLGLNKDVLILIFEELQDDVNSLYSCLLVNKSFCEIIVMILWKNPWKYLKSGKEEPLFNVITSHLSSETKANLMHQGINIFTNSYQRPLFNYIGFCRNLSLCDLSQIIYASSIEERYKRLIMKGELLKLFINKNTMFTSLSIPEHFDDQIHLIPGAERCFSALEFLDCSTSTSQEIVEGLARISKSIKKLEFGVAQSNNNPGIIKLIEAQRNLNHVFCYKSVKDERFCKALEESLIKHANTIQYLKIGWAPITNFLSYLTKLISLEIKPLHSQTWENLENVTLPALKVLKTQNIPSRILASIIDSTNGNLSEISSQYNIFDREKYYRVDNNALIQSIHEKCLNLKYLKLSIKNDEDILVLEKLLIKCQYLEGLIINSASREDLDWEKLFTILAKSSPTSLYKFKFIFNVDVELGTFKLFFENWKNRRSMLLKIYYRMTLSPNHINLFNEYKKEGVIKTYSDDPAEFSFDEFEWTFKTDNFS